MLEKLSRRSLITGLVSLLAAPAIVRASSLMPVKAITDLYPIYSQSFGDDVTRFTIDHRGFVSLETTMGQYVQRNVIARLNRHLPPPPPDTVGKFFGEIRTVRGDFEQMKYSSPPWEK